MDSETIQQAWNECEVEELEQFNGTRIDPAVFKPQLDEDFIFEERPLHRENSNNLWSAIQEMEGVVVMTEPLDGYLRCQAYIPDETSDISIRTYSNRIKISPAETDCTYEAFEHFINEFEDKVCELEFLGGLDEMDIDD